MEKTLTLSQIARFVRSDEMLAVKELCSVIPVHHIMWAQNPGGTILLSIHEFFITLVLICLKHLGFALLLIKSNGKL